MLDIEKRCDEIRASAIPQGRRLPPSAGSEGVVLDVIHEALIRELELGVQNAMVDAYAREKEIVVLLRLYVRLGTFGAFSSSQHDRLIGSIKMMLAREEPADRTEKTNFERQKRMLEATLSCFDGETVST